MIKIEAAFNKVPIKPPKQVNEIHMYISYNTEFKNSKPYHLPFLE